MSPQDTIPARKPTKAYKVGSCARVQLNRTILRRDHKGSPRVYGGYEGLLAFVSRLAFATILRFLGQIAGLR